MRSTDSGRPRNSASVTRDFVTADIRSMITPRAIRMFDRPVENIGESAAPVQSAPLMRAIITGASSGIGLELARELAKRGYALALLARRTDLLEELARELQSGAGDLAGRRSAA